MIQLDPIGREYVRLALRIERHFEGFVDAYYGPPELKAGVEAEDKRSIADLRRDAVTLAESVRQADMDAARRDYLAHQITAMSTVLRRLDGEEMSLVEEAQGCFGVGPQRVDEAEFESGLRELDTLLPGAGEVALRLADWRKQFELPAGRILPAIDLALAETRRRTAALFELPEGEAVEVQLVADKPWSGYNWYLGSYRSRIDVNTDLPVRANSLPGLMAHEAYPGHHTEHAIKERRWYREAGRLEHSIQLLLAPESFVAEAIATMAFDVIFPDQDELAGWLSGAFYPAAGIQADSQQQLRITQALDRLAGVSGNAAFMLHDDRRGEAEVLDYFRRYGLRSEREAQQGLRFIRSPQFRAYTFTYYYGRRLLKRAFEAGGMRETFGWAIGEPVTPSAIIARGVRA